MNYFKRTLSLFLSVLMIVLVIPQSVYAAIGEALDSAYTESEQLSNDYEVPYVIGEVEGKRTETSKTFRMSDGTYYLADYGFSVHYRDANNEWADYDNTLTFDETVDSDGMNGYVNNLSDVGVKFAKNAKSSNLLKLTSGNYQAIIRFL